MRVGLVRRARCGMLLVARLLALLRAFGSSVANGAAGGGRTHNLRLRRPTSYRKKISCCHLVAIFHHCVSKTPSSQRTSLARSQNLKSQDSSEDRSPMFAEVGDVLSTQRITVLSRTHPRPLDQNAATVKIGSRVFGGSSSKPTSSLCRLVFFVFSLTFIASHPNGNGTLPNITWPQQSR